MENTYNNGNIDPRNMTVKDVLNHVISAKKRNEEYLPMDRIIEEFNLDKERFAVQLENILNKINSLGSLTHENIELKVAIEHLIQEEEEEFRKFYSKDRINELFRDEDSHSQGEENIRFNHNEDYTDYENEDYYEESESSQDQSSYESNEFTDEDLAIQKTSILTSQFDLTKDEQKLLFELFLIFNKAPTFNKIKELLSEDAPTSQIYLATLFRDYWNENSHFHINLGRKYLHKSITYRVSLHYIKSTRPIDLDEAITEIERLNESWYSDHTLNERFQSFYEYLHFKIYGY